MRTWPRGSKVRLAKQTSNLFRGRTTPETGLDLSAFQGVYSVDPRTRRAVVGGLTTYEELLARTLPHGLAPLCVPQLKTITLGGAVAGLGIESASFRNGCPHESVVAMDVLTGAGDIVASQPGGAADDLFHGFPNSYGTLGYALRLEIELEPVAGQVEVAHLRAADVAAAGDVMSQIVASGEHDGVAVDFLDATVFAADEVYVTVGRYTDEPGPVSDYTGANIYYRSIQRRSADRLTAHDYFWRWDTDWFWCSRAFGVQRPAVRRLWPKRALRSDAYWRLVALDRRFRIAARIDRLAGRSPRENVVQDVEVPIGALSQFMEFFTREVGISPVWLCPMKQRDPRTQWPLYRFDPDALYVNVGFWSSVPRPDGDPADGRVNRAIEREVTRLGGRKSLYSTSFYSAEEFWGIYGGDTYMALKRRYDPDGRFATLYDKCVVTD